MHFKLIHVVNLIQLTVPEKTVGIYYMEDERIMYQNFPDYSQHLKYDNSVHTPGCFKYSQEANLPTVTKRKVSCNSFYWYTQLGDDRLTIFHTQLSWDTSPETDHSDNEKGALKRERRKSH